MWIKLDDGAASHPKIEALSDGAFRLWIHGLCYAATNLTDGRIPKAEAAGWAFALAMKAGDPAAWKTLLEELTEAAEGFTAPLWTLEESGYRIHDFLEYNPSREDVLRRREEAKERMRRLRERRPRIEKAKPEVPARMYENRHQQPDAGRPQAVRTNTKERSHEHTEPVRANNEPSSHEVRQPRTRTPSPSPPQIEEEGVGILSVLPTDEVRLRVKTTYLDAHRRYYRAKNGRAPQAPNLDAPEIDRLISKAVVRHSEDSATDACRGIFVTPHNTGRNERGEEYLGIRIALRIDARQDNVERFARNWVERFARNWARYRPVKPPAELETHEISPIESESWEAIRQSLESALGHEDFETWVAPCTPVRENEGVLEVAVPNKHFEHTVARYLGKVDSEIGVQLVVGE